MSGEGAVKRSQMEQDMVVYAFNSNTQETQAGISLRI